MPLAEYRNKIETLCRNFEKRDALRCLDSRGSVTSLSFGRLYREILDFEKTVRALSLCPGDRVALLDDRNSRAIPLFLSLSYHGIAAVILDTALPEEMLLQSLASCDCRAAFFCEKKFPFLAEKAEGISLADTSENIRIIKTAEHKNTVPGNPDVAAVLFSSGTTAAMKAVSVTYDSLLHSSEVILRTAPFTPDSDYLFLFPICHISGLASAVANLFFGGALDLTERFSADALGTAFRVYNPENFAMVPGVLELMIREARNRISGSPLPVRAYYRFADTVSGILLRLFKARFACRLLMKPFSDKIFGKRIRYVASGGGHCDAGTARAIMRMGIIFADFYASTECGVPIAVTGQWDKYAPETVGKADRNAEVSIRISRPDENGTGEILVRSAMMTAGYLGDEKATADAFENGYFKTGDLGFIDKKGYLHVTGRIKEAICLENGKKLSPETLEALIKPACPCDFAVCGIACGRKGYDAAAVFLCAEEADEKKREAVKSDIAAYCRKVMPSVPIDGIYFVNEIPRTRIGKPKRYLLADSVKKEVPVPVCEKEKSVFGRICRMISEKSRCPVSAEDRLFEIPGLHSLAVFELFVGIETEFGVSLAGAEANGMTVSGLSELVENRLLTRNAALPAVPKKKTVHRAVFALSVALAKRLWHITVSGLSHLPKNTAFVLCANHESHLDPLWILSSIPRRGFRVNDFCCMAKAVHWNKNRFIRFLSDSFGAILIEDYRAAALPMLLAEQCLKNGRSLLIFPEGTRSADGALGPFLPGAAELAIAAGVPVVPVCISGGYELYPASKKRPAFRLNGKKGRIDVRFGAPLSSEKKEARALTEEIRASVSDMKINRQRGEKSPF